MNAAVNCDKDGDGFIRRKLARFADIDEEDPRSLRSILSTATTQTDFIGSSKAIARSLGGSDFRFLDLKHTPTTVYLVLPPKYLTSGGNWFRLIIASALSDLWTEAKGPVPVLGILDEFAQLGHLAAIENAMGLAAGCGLQLWPILQDLTQIQDLYGKRWETFLDNAGIKQFFGTAGNTTADYVSKNRRQDGYHLRGIRGAKRSLVGGQLKFKHRSIFRPNVTAALAAA